MNLWDLGMMLNSVNEFCILRALKVHGRPSRASKIYEVFSMNLWYCYCLVGRASSHSSCCQYDFGKRSFQELWRSMMSPSYGNQMANCLVNFGVGHVGIH
ncbi:hypothetical protein DVH24_028448 [Malus domestica]|uniref:Uncharacterized protein n=1 Tax=Malus domestica TaxID=3750 RepID=A0A498HGP3_MALDO|nr:hypothetical protein DVH24_028448 [Malus domestica]